MQGCKPQASVASLFFEGKLRKREKSREKTQLNIQGCKDAKELEAR